MLGSRAVRLGVIAGVVLVVLGVALLTVPARPARFRAASRPVLKVLRPSPGHDTVASLSQTLRFLSDGYPDGKGHALFWANQADNPNVWQLFCLPQGNVLAIASAFDYVFWAAGGVAAGEITVRKSGIPVLARLPFLKSVRAIYPHRDLKFYAIDTERLTIAPLPAAMWPVVRYTRGSTMFEDPSLAETARLGDMQVSLETWTDGNKGCRTQLIKLADTMHKTSRTLFETSGAAHISDPFFLDVAAVMFKEDNTVWQVGVSTGNAVQVWPPPDEPLGAPAVESTALLP